MKTEKITNLSYDNKNLNYSDNYYILSSLSKFSNFI